MTQTKTLPNSSAPLPLKVGLVGTGYAAKLRAETIQADQRSQLVAVVGHTPEKTEAFCQTHQTQAFKSWAELVEHPELDLVVISTVNRDHGAIARAVLQAGKHVVVEYPLALEVSEAEELIAFAQAQGKLLHVEHIELLGGVHQALRQALPKVGTVFYARYATINPQHPAPPKWTYHPELFGFPLIGAISRLHRLIDLFGQVATVSCQSRFWEAGKVSAVAGASPYQACICHAQLQFKSGLLAEVVYAKGETLWQAARTFEVQGDQGALIFEGENGSFVQAGQTQPLEVGGRRGLFAKDTKMVLDYLTEGTPLYLSASDSLYTLKVADAAQRSAQTGQVVQLQ